MSNDNTLRGLSVAELAEDAFLKAEYVRQLSMVNIPTDFDDRKKAFVNLAVAQSEAVKAQAALEEAISLSGASQSEARKGMPSLGVSSHDSPAGQQKAPPALSEDEGR